MEEMYVIAHKFRKLHLQVERLATAEIETARREGAVRELGRARKDLCDRITDECHESGLHPDLWCHCCSMITARLLELEGEK